jgi:endoglucanase
MTEAQYPSTNRTSLMLRSPNIGSILVGGCLSAGSLTSGCITSGPGEYGVSAEVRDLDYKLCPDGLIDDGEDNDSQINTIGERGGYWYSNKDEYGSTIEPVGDFKMAEGGAEGSKYAARMKGTMAAGGPNIYPYVSIGFNLSNPKAPYDVGKAQGIQFWAKGSGKVRFKTPDVMTDPAGEICTNCYNDFGVDIFFDDDWQRYTVPFAKMEQQPGWGDRAPRVAKDRLFAVAWQFGTASKDYDIWVDNIALVGCDQ